MAVVPESAGCHLPCGPDARHVGHLYRALLSRNTVYISRKSQPSDNLRLPDTQVQEGCDNGKEATTGSVAPVGGGRVGPLGGSPGVYWSATPPTSPRRHRPP